MSSRASPGLCRVLGSVVHDEARQQHAAAAVGAGRDTELMLPLLLFGDGWYANRCGVMIEACERTQGQFSALRSVLLLQMVGGQQRNGRVGCQNGSWCKTCACPLVLLCV